MKIFNLTNTISAYNKNLNYTFDKSLAEIIIVGGKKIDLKEFPKLKGIFKTGVGTDNLPFKECKGKDILIELPSNKTKEIIYNETAIFTLHLILSLFYKSTGNFNRWEKIKRKSSKNTNVLIVGLGNIGKKVFNLTSPIFNVETFDILSNSLDELDDKLKLSDFVTLHIPLNDQTYHFMNENRLSKLKNKCCLINTSRGQIVDEDALYNELESKRIFAALDVFSKEPYVGKLNSIKGNLIKTPHIASSCIGFYDGLANDFIKFYKKINESY
tara:strand:- start:269 stop:1081 length:813 start_codon:yes stop_codon:yes gene_type:complete